MQDLVSVIIPVYNVSEVLQQCLESVINQTYDYLEIILINDGSTDNSGAICDMYEKNDERIRVVHKKNGGAATARNRGLEIAKGKYISFIDSDDWVEEDFIERLYKIIIENDVDISQVKLISENEKMSINSIRKDKIEIISGKEAIKNLYKRETYINTMTPCNKLYKKDIFNTLRYPEGMMCEDEAIIHEVLYNCNKVGINNSILYHYVVRENSVTTSSFSIKNLDAIKSIEKRLEFFNKENEDELILMTLPTYFRILLENLTKLEYSNIENKDKYINKVKSKLKLNMKDFEKNKNMRIQDLILLNCCKLSLSLGVSANKSLIVLKNMIKSTMMKPIWRLP